jgi:hypothetical protein
MEMIVAGLVGARVAGLAEAGATGLAEAGATGLVGATAGGVTASCCDRRKRDEVCEAFCRRRTNHDRSSAFVRRVRDVPSQGRGDRDRLGCASVTGEVAVRRGGSRGSPPADQGVPGGAHA